MKTYLSNHVEAGSIFHVEYLNYKGKARKHYFFCIYSQSDDDNNLLFEDVVGLLISTNKKFGRLDAKGYNDYNAEVLINNRKAWVCTDKSYRFSLTDKKIKLTPKIIKLTTKEKEDVLARYTRFYLEATRQLLENAKKT